MMLVVYLGSYLATYNEYRQYSKTINRILFCHTNNFRIDHELKFAITVYAKRGQLYSSYK